MKAIKLVATIAAIATVFTNNINPAKAELTDAQVAEAVSGFCEFATTPSNLSMGLRQVFQPIVSKGEDPSIVVQFVGGIAAIAILKTCPSSGNAIRAVANSTSVTNEDVFAKRAMALALDVVREQQQQQLTFEQQAALEDMQNRAMMQREMLRQYTEMRRQNMEFMVILNK
jgi:hypothetical protein